MRIMQALFSVLGVLPLLFCLQASGSWSARAADTPRLKPPTSGTPRERVQTLWGATRPVILADAKAGLSDAEYLRRRTDVFGPWVGLQIAFAREHLPRSETDAANKLIVNILGLIDRVYGISYYKEPKRLDIRARAIKKIEPTLAALDRQAAALPINR